MRCIRSLLLVHVFVLLWFNALPLNGSARFSQEQPNSDSGTVYELAEVTPPKPVYQPNPTYTESARRKKINGTVTVVMIVTPEGKVREVKVTKSLDKDLDQQAVTIVSTWKFQPATKDGKPVAVHLSAEVAF